MSSYYVAHQGLTAFKCVRTVITLNICLLMPRFHMVHQLILAVGLVSTLFTLEPRKPCCRRPASLPTLHSEASLPSWLFLPSVASLLLMACLPSQSSLPTVASLPLLAASPASLPFLLLAYVVVVPERTGPPSVTPVLEFAPECRPIIDVLLISLSFLLEIVYDPTVFKPAPSFPFVFTILAG